MKNFGVKWILVIFCISLVLISTTLVGVTTYNTAKKDFLKSNEMNLNQQVVQYETYVESIYNEINLYEELVDKQVKAAVSEEAKAIYEMVYAIEDEELLKETISKIVVGSTGYIWVVNYEGDYVVSKSRSRDGENIWAAKDSTGRFFIQDAIVKGKKLKGNNLDYEIYPWMNTGETVARNKIAALVHIPEKEWVIGVSTYFDELTFQQGIETKLNEMNEMLSSIVVGESGFAFLMDTSGTFVFHPKAQGENWINDEEFVRHIVQTEDGYYRYLSPQTGTYKIAAYKKIDGEDLIVALTTFEDELLSGLKGIKNQTLLICLIAILVSFVLVYFGSNVFSSQMGHANRVIERVAKGDLTQRIQMKSKVRELQNISISFDGLIDYFRELIAGIKQSADNSAASSSELSGSAQEVNASVEQVSSTVSEIAKGAQELSKNAGDASVKSTKTQESAEIGAKSAKEVGNKMQGINLTTKEGAEKVRALGEKSKKIGDIINTINNISEQTNLLALNAAIEAARAGEAGRGFAVVADEVRKLAEESQKATGTIGELIGGIQSEISSSVESMDKNNQQVEEGMASVNGAIMAFQEIPNLVSDVNKAIQGISAVAEENAAGSEEVNASVEQVTSAMQQVATTAEQLSKGANSLKEMVNKFKI